MLKLSLRSWVFIFKKIFKRIRNGTSLCSISPLFCWKTKFLHFFQNWAWIQANSILKKIIYRNSQEIHNFSRILGLRITLQLRCSLLHTVFSEHESVSRKMLLFFLLFFFFCQITMKLVGNLNVSWWLLLLKDFLFHCGLWMEEGLSGAVVAAQVGGSCFLSADVDVGRCESHE